MGGFPGGISDERGEVGYLAIGGELVAVDLADGGVRWRRAEAAEPVAASGRYLLTRRDGPVEPVFELRDSGSGETVSALAAADIPGLEGMAPEDLLEATMTETEEGAEIKWRCESRYGGGAVPPGGKAGPAGAAGTLLIPAEAPAQEVRPAPQAADCADDQYSLREEDGQVVLEARGGDGARRWQTTIARAAGGGPGPLRA